jgi:hypothetical protein
MKIKYERKGRIRRRRSRRARHRASMRAIPRRRKPPQREEPDCVEVGYGEFCVITQSVIDGSTVVHRFRTREEAEAQHRRNVAADNPLVGLGGLPN